MLGARRLVAAAVVAGAILVGVGFAALVAPATSAASCAGCAQYTNPLGSTTQPATHSGTVTASQTTSPPATQTATPPPSTTPASTDAPAATATTTDPEPTATAASGAVGGSTTTSGPRLPHTGYDSWTIVGFGVVLLGGGLVVRRRIRRA